MQAFDKLDGMRKHYNALWVTNTGGIRYCYVSIAGEMDIKIASCVGGGNATVFTIDRKEARLLAKRINQCLDATVKK